MSIIEPSDTTIGPEPAVSPTETRESPAPEVEAVETPEAEAPEVFDREYVEKLRKENASWRERAHNAEQYDSTFEGYDDETKAGWLQLIELAKEAETNPEVQSYLAEMLGFEIEPAAPAGDFLTREEAAAIARQEAQAIYGQDQAMRQQEQAVSSVQSQAKDLGYDTNPESDAYINYIDLLRIANEMDEPDLQAAHEQVQAREQARYAQFIARKEEEARTSPATPSGNGVAPATAKLPYRSDMSESEKWAAVRQSVDERLSNI